MLDFAPDPYYQDPRMGGANYMMPQQGVPAPEGGSLAQAPIREVTYQRDIAPAAGRLFRDIGGDSNLSEQAKLQLQGNLLQGVASITEQRDKIAQMRENSELRQMRLESDRMRLEDVRNSRAMKQGMQEKLSGLNSQFEEVMKLPIEQRAQKVAEIEAKNFDLLASSPYVGARFESIKRSSLPPKQEEMFGSGSQVADAFAKYGNDEVWRKAYSQGNVAVMGLRQGELDVQKESQIESKKTREEREKEVIQQRDSLLGEFTKKPFTLDMQKPDLAESDWKPTYMSDETHARAEQAVMLFGSDEDKSEWEEANNDLNTRDKLRARIAQNVVLKAQVNKFKKQESKQPEDISETLVPSTPQAKLMRTLEKISD